MTVWMIILTVCGLGTADCKDVEAKNLTFKTKQSCEDFKQLMDLRPGINSITCRESKVETLTWDFSLKK